MADRAAPDYKPVGEPERIPPAMTGYGDAPQVTTLHRQSAALNGSVRVGTLSALGTHLSARAAPRTQGAVAQLVGDRVADPFGQLFLARQAARAPHSPRIQALINGLAPAGGAAPAPWANQPAAPVALPAAPLAAAAPLANQPAAPVAPPPAPLVAAAPLVNQPAAPLAMPPAPLVAAAPLANQPAAPAVPPPAPLLGAAPLANQPAAPAALPPTPVTAAALLANQPVVPATLPPAPRPIAAASTAAALFPPAYGPAAGDSAPASASASGSAAGAVAAAGASSGSASARKFVNDQAFRNDLGLSADEEEQFNDRDEGSIERNILSYLAEDKKQRLTASTAITTEQAHGLAKTAAAVAGHYPADRWSYIGLGRSPVLVLEYLKHKFSAYTFEVPLGSLSKFEEAGISASKAYQAALRRSIETTFTPEAGKNYVILDYSENGGSLRKAHIIFKLLYPAAQFEAMPLSLNDFPDESANSPGNKFHKMVGEDPAIQAFVLRLRLMIGKSAFSSFKSHDIAEAIKGTLPEPVPGAAENRRALIAEVASLVNQSAAGEAAGAAPRPPTQG